MLFIILLFPSRLFQLIRVCILGAGGPDGNQEVCGAMTSGGTESILSAVKATRDYMRFTKGVRRPQMIVAVSAHSAYYKAAEYFNIQLIQASSTMKPCRLSCCMPSQLDTSVHFP